ncbi:MAG TPA: NUDIX domain-containing protein [bacterium]
MMRWLYIAAFYGWLGFTVGYFFRKWLQVRFLPNREAAARPLSASAVEMVDWIDEQGRLVRSLPRAEIRSRNLLHRVTATFVFHPDGRLFIQQRTMTKDVYPGLFDVCVGGTVVTGESFELNARREIGEELGLRGVAVYPLFDHRFADARTNSAIRVFACVYGGKVTFQPEEVADGFWADWAKVDALVASGKVCPDSTQGLRMYRQKYGARNFAQEIAPGLKPVAPEE